MKKLFAAFLKRLLRKNNAMEECGAFELINEYEATPPERVEII